MNGNLSSGNGWTYSWDYRNRLLGATNGTDTATYSYDGDYNRMVANNNGSLTFYPSAGFEISGQGLTKNIFANGLLVSTITNSVGTETVPSVENIYYVHTDHLTGSNVVTNSTGAIEQVLDYILTSICIKESAVAGFFVFLFIYAKILLINFYY